MTHNACHWKNDTCLTGLNTPIDCPFPIQTLDLISTRMRGAQLVSINLHFFPSKIFVFPKKLKPQKFGNTCLADCLWGVVSKASKNSSVSLSDDMFVYHWTAFLVIFKLEMTKTQEATRRPSPLNVSWSSPLLFTPWSCAVIRRLIFYVIDRVHLNWFKSEGLFRFSIFSII